MVKYIVDGKTCMTANGEYMDTFKGDMYAFNYSSILTFLIKEVGKNCESYASDLFISWESVMDYLMEYDESDSKEFVFGIRECGVDHSEFVNARVSNPSVYGTDIYKAMYILKIEKFGRKAIMTFNGCNAVYTAD